MRSKIFAATFGDAESAGKALATVAGALGRGLTQGAVVQKAADGKISFVETKDMTTGQGGVITTNDPELAAQASALRNHGLDSNAWKRYSAETNSRFPGHQTGVATVIP